MNNNISSILIRAIEEHQHSNEFAANFSKQNEKFADEVIDGNRDFITSSPSNVLSHLKMTKKEFDLAYEKWAKLDCSPKSKYQNPIIFRHLIGLYDEVENIIVNHKGNTLKTFPIELASAYTGHINAHVLTVKDKNEFAIIFDESVLTLANLMSKIFAQIIPLKKGNKIYTISLHEDDLTEKINQQEDTVVNSFFDLFMSMIIYGVPSKAKQYFLTLTNENSYFYHSFLHTFELFIMAHECGHIHLRHFDEGKLTHTPPEWLKESTDHSLLYSQQCEIEADLFAAEIVVCSLIEKEEPIFAGVVGILLFFEYQLFIERFIYFFQFGEDIWDTPDYFSLIPSMQLQRFEHPHAFIRRMQIIEYLKEAFPNEHNMIDNIDKFVFNACNSLWNKSLSGVKKIREQKIEIHSIWEPLVSQIIDNKETSSSIFNSILEELGAKSIEEDKNSLAKQSQNDPSTEIKKDPIAETIKCPTGHQYHRTKNGCPYCAASKRIKQQVKSYRSTLIKSFYNAYKEDVLNIPNLEDLVGQYGYMFYKASAFLLVGSEEYRYNDYFHYPLTEWNQEKLVKGCEQWVHAKGVIEQYYLEDLTREEIQDLFELFHYSMIDVEPSTKEGVSRIILKHKMDGRECAVFCQLKY